MWSIVVVMLGHGAPSVQRVVIPAKDHLVSSRPHLKSRAGRSQAREPQGYEHRNRGHQAQHGQCGANYSTSRATSRWSPARRAGSGCASPRCWRENGAAVALVARRADRLAAVQARIEQAGGRAIAIAADVLDRAAMMRAFDEAEKAFGTVTILVNNAGVAHADRAVDLPAEEWRRVLSAPISTQCSSGRRRPRAACWRRKRRRHRQHRLGARLRRLQGRRRLCGGQGRRRPAHQGARRSSSPSRASASMPSRRAGS